MVWLDTVTVHSTRQRPLSPPLSLPMPKLFVVLGGVALEDERPDASPAALVSGMCVRECGIIDLPKAFKGSRETV